MKPLLALLLWMLLTADAGAAGLAQGPLLLCEPDCQPVDLTQVPLSSGETTLVSIVSVDPAALPLDRPPMVSVVALASSEVRWNGNVIGRNGTPSPDAAGERPGRFITSFVVPARLVRPGRNRLSVRMSAHHLWLPVRRPIHLIEVVPYDAPQASGVSHYLPALLTLGALLAACLYFAAAAWSERGERGLRLLAAVAAAGALQLIAEVSRAFVAYSYPWHLARVSAIALLAAATAVLLAAYAARRLVPDRVRLTIAGTSVAALASLLLIPWYDLKALGAIFAGALSLGTCGLAALRHRRRDALAALVAATAIVVVMLIELTLFLDRTWFMLLALMLALLVGEQVSKLKRTRLERDLERGRAAALAQRLARAERDGEAIVQLKDGSRVWRVAEDDIVAIRAADDYCEASLADGRTLLVTTGLYRLMESLPARFVRVHKSWAVNRSHILSAAPRPGGGRLLNLSNGAAVPVGRSYTASLPA